MIKDVSKGTVIISALLKHNSSCINGIFGVVFF